MKKELISLRVFDRVTFKSGTHIYLVDGKPSANKSVTGVLERCKPVFELDKWAEISAKKAGITPEEQKEIWRIGNLYSTTKGSIIHNYIENYYSNKFVPYDKGKVERELGVNLHAELRSEIPYLIKQFYTFFNDTKSVLMPIKNEFIVGDIDNTKICGMLDLLMYNIENDTFELLDIKTNKNIKTVNPWGEKLLDPVSYLDSCEFNTYSLQLSLYKHFIEKYTCVKIAKHSVVWFNSDNDSYKVIDTNDLQDECAAILSNYPRC
jgi:hypothetical protein